jgi:hypothetical protein
VLAPVANTASGDLLQRLGFHEREHFTEIDALQSLWSRELAA